MPSQEKEKNISDLRKFKKEKLNFFSRIFHPLRTKRFVQKIERIPMTFWEMFDQESYLSVNRDVENAVMKKVYRNALEHFIRYGYDEVREGKRRLGREFPLLSEKEYVRENPEIKEFLRKGLISSWFDHFMTSGHEVFYKGEHGFTGEYPFQWTDPLVTHVKRYFDEEAYLEVNDDVSAAVSDGRFTDAWEHFFLLGAEEVRKGERRLHPAIPRQSEAHYAFYNKDIFNNEKYPDIDSPFEHFLKYGAKEMIDGERSIPQPGSYSYTEPRLTMKIKKEMEAFVRKPSISILMSVHNTDVKYLKSAMESLERQWYDQWELCIVDDASTSEETLKFLRSINSSKIKIKFLEQRMYISTVYNTALQFAQGEYIIPMKSHDVLTVDALYEAVRYINETNMEFVYSDEDSMNETGQHCADPYFKPNFAPDMLLSQNYIRHLAVMKKSLVQEAGAWTVGLEDACDYDLYLRISERTDRIGHISKVLYHNRDFSSSKISENDIHTSEAEKKVLENTLKRRNIEADVLKGKDPGTYRIQYKIKTSEEGESPLISIVIPFKDKPELLDMCINSILDKSTYQNYEIIGISNNSNEKATYDMMKILKAKSARVHFYEYNEPFNYSAINNYAVEHYVKGEHIVLLNNDIEIISPEWLEAMLEFSQRPDVGAVGAKLYFPNDTVQHAGVILGIWGLAGHAHKYYEKDSSGYFNRLNIIQNFSAVTAACLMVKKSIYQELKGLNEENLKVAFNDVDFCLRIREKGYLNVYTPYCEAYHYESISRGSDDQPEKAARARAEIEYMQEKYSEFLKNGDPYYNKNLSLDDEEFKPSGYSLTTL